VLHLDNRICFGRPAQDGGAARRRSGRARHSAERNPGHNSHTKKDIIPRIVVSLVVILHTPPVAGAFAQMRAESSVRHVPIRSAAFGQ
jgi:hypothetical protein